MLPWIPDALQPDFEPVPAPDVPGKGVEHHCQICPTCGYRLTGYRCKLVCTQCGYYLSCADYY